jgi:hypothetical protein
VVRVAASVEDLSMTMPFPAIVIVIEYFGGNLGVIVTLVVGST